MVDLKTFLGVLPNQYCLSGKIETAFRVILLHGPHLLLLRPCVVHDKLNASQRKKHHLYLNTEQCFDFTSYRILYITKS